MIIRKRRGKNELMPIRIYQGEYMLAAKLGVPIEEYVKAAVFNAAKARRWKWFLERYSIEAKVRIS